MAISRERFDLALDMLGPGDWERFEQLASAFLASEFSGHRTLASPGGDGGRDAELYKFDNEPTVMFQFSVQATWKAKIQATLMRLKDSFPDLTALIFLTQLQIGASGDALRLEARKKGIYLDIRDRSWFLDRMNLDDNRREAATIVARAMVDPMLESKNIPIDAPALNGQEARTALIFLEMQACDEDSSKGLTKACYESLVRAALHQTSATARKTRDEIYNAVGGFLPRYTKTQLKPFIDAALKRLEKGAVKHWQKEDEFHISFAEAERIKDKAASLQLLSRAFERDVDDAIGIDSGISEATRLTTITLVRRVVETYFYRLGEEFVQCLTQDKDLPLYEDTIRNILLEITPTGRPKANISWVEFLYRIATGILSNPSENTIEHFHVLSTAYTFFAFLSEVPDVQKATKKLFSGAILWFDTTALLPLIAEQAFPDDMRPFTFLMAQLKRSGLRLLVTVGIIEEIERHLNRCRAFAQHQGTWQGRVPYVYERYVLAGGKPESFPRWLENFVGGQKPVDDLADFLREDSGVLVSDPISVGALDPDVVQTVRSYWQDIQKKRRTADDGLHAFRLAEHDAENYLSVLAQRHLEYGKAVLGYTSWLVTLDSAAGALLSKVDVEIKNKIKHTPVISIDFLMKYLSFGPRRDQVDTSARGHTRVFVQSISENISPDLIATARQIRSSCHDLPERLVQRRIRDGLDRERMRIGDLQRAGLDDLDSTMTSLF